MEFQRSSHQCINQRKRKLFLFQKDFLLLYVLKKDIRIQTSFLCIIMLITHDKRHTIQNAFQRSLRVNALIKEKGNFLIHIILHCTAQKNFHVISNIRSTIENRRTKVSCRNAELTDKKETRRATTYFQYMKIGSADARVSNSDSNIVRSRIRHIRFPQRKSVILHVEAEEFHLLVMHG